MLEKLVHIHGLGVELAADDDRQPPPRSGRHFYDIHQLLGDDRVLDLLNDRHQVDEMIASIDEISQQFFDGNEGMSVRPNDGFAAGPAFDPATSISARLRAAYDTTMPELYFGNEPLPTWEEICARVAQRAALL